MRVAILSDIHGNADALSAVLVSARAAGVERLIVAGDFVGYYYAIERVMALLDAWPYVAVRGNHEDMLAEWHAGRGREEMRAQYGAALQEAERRLSPAQLDWLLALPATRRETIGGRLCFICHGSPRSTDEYIYPDAPEEKVALFFREACDLSVFGHTHHPVVWRRGHAITVNPGSVGQPRDYQPGACWALWDVEDHMIELRREWYDMTDLLCEVAMRDPHLDYLANVLTRVR